MKKIAMLVAVAGTAAAAHAQFAFPSFNPSPSAIGTTWTAQDMLTLNGGSVPAGTYTSYLLVYDYTANNGTQPATSSSIQWTSEGRSTLSTTAGSGTGTTPTYGAGNVVRASNTSGPVGSASSSITTPNLYWTGSLTGGYTGGTNPLFLNYRQSFNNTAGPNANWSNVRLVLNPSFTYSSPTNVATGVAAPTSGIIDIGQVDAGGAFSYHSAAVTTSAAMPLQWFRFTMGSGGQVPGFLLDIDSNDNALSQSSADSEMHLFFQQADGSLVLINTDDDDGVGNRSLLTFGSTDPTANGRNYGNAADAVYNGRDGVSALFGAGTYFVALGQYNGGATALPAFTSTLSPSGTGLAVQYAWSNSTLTAPTSYITTQLNLNFVPTPGCAALLGIGALAAGRRRRA